MIVALVEVENVLRVKWYSTERTCGEETGRDPVDPKVVG
jgi:hypothetical protein